MHGIDDAGGRAGSARRAELIARAGSLAAALADGSLPLRQTITLSEAVVLGLLAQDVRTYLTVLGHGSTDIGEMLRIYGAAGLLRTVPMHHETAAAHAASALRWTTGEKAAVVTSIGPGALQAMAGSLVSASDGLGVWHLYGDETTEDEGPNMQQIPKHEQGLFLRLCSTMGHAYSLHTPAAVGPALRRGGNVVDHPYRPGPFYLLLPLNTQPSELVDFNLHELPVGPPPAIGPANDRTGFRAACDQIRRARQVVVRVGGGATGMTAELIELLDAVDGVAVIAPRATGAVPYGHPRVAGVGGTKGSIAGNFVMEHADLLISIGSRSVCQSDCSRTGYPNVRHVININADVDAAMHYNETTALVGDARTTTAELVAALRASGDLTDGAQRSEWLERCAAAKQEWAAFKQARYDHPRLHDPVWSSEVLTQPAAIKIATDWARSIDARVFFDAGDVQANGFQIVEDDAPGRVFTETGASYMGFATSAVLAGALASEPFYSVAITGDGSFMMNPQVLIDGTHQQARGCILILDNRRMGAISSLQRAQYGIDHATNDDVAVDYVQLASAVDGVAGIWGGTTPDELDAALAAAAKHAGVSVVHVPVYFGDDELGGLGAYGRWNVGSWVAETQALRHDHAM